MDVRRSSKPTNETEKLPLLDQLKADIRAEWSHFPMLYTKNGLEPIQKVFKDNLKPAFTIAMISLPLSSALAVASNVHPVMGITTSFWSGLVMSIFGSSDLNVVGCSGALSPLMTSYTVQWGQEIVPYVAFIAGGFLLIFRLLRLDKYMFHMPAAVFEGFSIAVAIIIGLNQINFACGLSPNDCSAHRMLSEDVAVPQDFCKHPHFYMNVYESIAHLGDTHMPSLGFFLINTLTLLVLMKLPSQRWPLKTAHLPWIPISAFVGCIIGWIVDPDDGAAPMAMDDGTAWLPTLKSKYGFLEAQFIYPLRPLSEMVPPGEEVQLVVAGLFTALVCALETILSAKVAAVRAGHPFVESRELSAVTLSSFIEGLVGALPNTGLFLRTSANVSTGATHRMSQFMHVIILGVVVLALGAQFSYLPQAGAAAILATGSMRMVPYMYLIKLWHVDRWRLALTGLVALVSVFQDPVIGLGVGIFIALMANATMVVEGHGICDVKPLSQKSNVGVKVTVNGPISYVTGEQVEKTLKAQAGKAEVVVVNMTAVPEVDTDGVVALEKTVAHMQNATPPCLVLFTHVRRSVAEKMRRVHGLAKLEQDVQARKELDIMVSLQQDDDKHDVETDSHYSSQIKKASHMVDQSNGETSWSQQIPAYALTPTAKGRQPSFGQNGASAAGKEVFRL